MTLARVHFQVPELSLLQFESFIKGNGSGITRRTWIEILLTHLCCPSIGHPVPAQRGCTTDQLLILARAQVVDPDSARYEFRWPRSILQLVEPSLEGTEQKLGSFLSTLWQWSQAPDGLILATLSARLAAFSSYWAREPQTWADLYGKFKGEHIASPFDLYKAPEYRPERLPWVVRIPGA